MHNAHAFNSYYNCILSVALRTAKMKSHIYSITLILWALLFIIPTSYCSAASSNGVFTHAKLTRARREVANENVYFIETRDEIDPYKYVTEMAALQKNRTFDGYHFELQGIATGVAHGFSAVLSLRALTEVSNYALKTSLWSPLGHTVPPMVSIIR